jgi:hypothetical protein
VNNTKSTEVAVRGGRLPVWTQAGEPVTLVFLHIRGGGADVGTDGMRPGQLERLDGVRDELAHRGRFEEFVAPLGVSEAGQVDRDQMGVLGQA